MNKIANGRLSEGTLVKSMSYFFSELSPFIDASKLFALYYFVFDVFELLEF